MIHPSISLTCDTCSHDWIQDLGQIDTVKVTTKGKQLTNVRASGTDEALTLTPPVRHTLEQALEFIEDDDLVEVTPDSIRLRKKLLQEHERRRASRS